MFKLKEFQENSIKQIISLLNKGKEEIVIQSPTGSGKTVILALAVRDYLKQDKGSHCFFWFSPGNGELEEQSKDNQYNGYRILYEQKSLTQAY